MFIYIFFFVTLECKDLEIWILVYVCSCHNLVIQTISMKMFVCVINHCLPEHDTLVVEKEICCDFTHFELNKMAESFDDDIFKCILLLSLGFLFSFIDDCY